MQHKNPSREDIKDWKISQAFIAFLYKYVTKSFIGKDERLLWMHTDSMFNHKYMHETEFEKNRVATITASGNIEHGTKR